MKMEEKTEFPPPTRTHTSVSTLIDSIMKAKQHTWVQMLLQVLSEVGVIEDQPLSEGTCKHGKRRGE